jgi:ABC-type Fe3+ transport system substrate-binding protein
MILGKTLKGRTIMAIRLAPALAALGLLASAALPADAQSLDDLYAKAKGEGAFVLYAGGPTAPWEAMAKTFNATYPGINISISGGFSNVLDKKIDAQIAAGKLEVDAAILQTIADFVRWKAAGRLIDFKPSGFDRIDPSFKDRDGAYWATMVNAVPYMYNTDKVTVADVPNSALDFLKPQFQGKIVTAYPADDDVTLWVFYHIVQKYGWDYMDKYMAAKPNFIQGHLGEQRSIGSGQNLVTFDSIFNTTNVLKKQGMPVDSHFPTVDATPFWPLAGAIFKNAPHSNAAKLFLSWLLEPAQQIATGTWSGRSDVPPPAGYKPIFSYKAADDYRAFLTDQSKVADLRSRFEKYTGPIVNTGGVR